MDNGKQILPEFLIGGSALVEAVHHDPRSCRFKDVADEVKGKSGEPVFVGNHNLAYSSIQALSKKGSETRSCPIKA